jgi:hypothetical protein
MEYSGLIQKYKLNRPLTDDEEQNHLLQKQRLDIDPVQILAVTKVNSTYLETADKYYGWKGFLSAWSLAVSCSMIWAYGLMAYTLIFLNYLNPTVENPEQALYAFILLNVLLLPVFVLNIWGFRKEAFTYTHFPIRLNRKNRMMYVFRLNGTVLTIPWNKVYFTIGKGTRMGSRDIRCHVLDDDGVTVRETFALGWEWPSVDDLKRFWELHRRYMEEGPQAIMSQIDYCLPIVNRKEPYLLGLRRLLFNLGNHFVLQLAILPFFLFFSLGRVIAMKTSKIPQWPQEVEEACRIEEGDPFERDARHNPPDSYLWKLVRAE